MQAFGPGFEESVAGLCAITDDREAAGGTADEQHLPLRIGQITVCIDFD